jgi:histidine kinase
MRFSVQFPGFSQVAHFFDGGQAIVYRAVRDGDHRPVVIKVLRGPYPSADAVRRFRREASITAFVQGEGVIELLEDHQDGAPPWLVVEDFSGVSLDQHLAKGPLPPRAVMEVGIAIAQALARVHERMVLHKDLNPANVVWNRPTGKVKLIDFGISSTVSRERPQLTSPSVLQGTLSYIAPELTGRMNRAVDYRSDFYSLGATLYALLTGAPPFSGTDPLELVHAHVARQPTDPRELVPSVPEDLAAVVLKLLAKTAEDRYQSSYGLRRDLERCLENDDAGLSQRRFLLGRHDRPTRVQAPQQLYGREVESAQLVDALGRAARGGREVVLVSGYSGVGKTSLVNEVHRPMVVTGGTYLSGKFDQFRRGLPFASLADAFSQLFLSMLAGTKAEVERWKNLVSDAVGESGQVLVDLVPELELLIGQQPDPPAVAPAEAEARVHLLFRRLIASLARPGKPLVLFVDDLQWADLPTIRLFEQLAGAIDLGHLLVIGSYRDNEVDATHPLTATIGRLRANNTSLTELTLAPLGATEVRRYLEDALHAEPGELGDLPGICQAKTGGNPFFLSLFVHALENRGALRFDLQAGNWAWDAAAIDALGITDNVVDLMTHAIAGLPADARNALCFASIAGSSVHLGLLASLVERDPRALQADIQVLHEAGLLVVVASGLAPDEADGGLPMGDERYEFVHDRVQQAAYGLVPTADRLRAHLRLGRLLRDREDDPETGEELFDVVSHLNMAAELVSGDERLQLVRLNLSASRRARESAAYAVALDLAQAALRLLGDAPFERSASLARAAHLDVATAAYLAQRYDLSAEHVDVLLDWATHPLDAVPAIEVRMASHNARHQNAESIRAGLDGLALLGVPLPEHPDFPAVMDAMGACGALLAATDLSLLPGAPDLDDPVRLAVMRLLMSMNGDAFIVRPLLVPVLASAAVEISVKEGLAPESALAFTMYGLSLVSGGYVEQGYGLGALGVGLTARFPRAHRVNIRTRHVYMFALRHWKEAVRSYRQEYAELADDAIAAGDFEYASYAQLMGSTYLFVDGNQPLDEVEAIMARYAASMRSLAQDSGGALLAPMRQSVRNLCGLEANDTVLTGAACDEAAMTALFEGLNNATGLFVLRVYKSILCFFLGEYDLARQLVAGTKTVISGGIGVHSLVLFNMIDALLSLWQYEKTQDPADLAACQAARTTLEGWVGINPAGGDQKLQIVDAEIARSEGRWDDATRRYDRAIDTARRNAFTSEEALACQLAARFFDSRGSRLAARGYWLEARYAFQRWGAFAVVRRLDADQPWLLQASHTWRAGRTMGSTVATMAESTDLDSEAVIRSSQAISQVIVLSDLVRLLVKLAIESSGARKAVLLLERHGNFYVRAIGRAEPELEVQVPTAVVSAVDSEDVSPAVVNYVRNARRETLLADAMSEGPFQGDRYIQHNNVRSLLALPVEHKGELNAILVLENDRTAGVFSEARLALARVLLSQAAISIENATLYEGLEEKVRERTVELEAARAEAESAHQQSDTLLKNTLPAVIAEELKDTGSARPVLVPSATVLFTDFVGFTEVASRLSPAELVDELEACFNAFDDIMDRWGLEKLKTIGDSYMAVGGLPRRNGTHALDCAMAGLELVAWMTRPRLGGATMPFKVRVGLHTGPLVAGVIGRRRFAYDVWGDTVNVASRMESSGEPGRVNMSAVTASLVRPWLNLEYRGLVNAKGKGEIEMYFANSLVPAMSVDGAGRVPNDTFRASREAVAASWVDEPLTMHSISSIH